MKTIFLDIDGVLNVDYADRDQFGHIFRDEYVQNLKEIIEKTGAKIVISSTWKDKGIERMLALWKERNLPGEIIDVTPDCVDVCEATNIVYYDQVKRGHEIKLWLDRHPEVTQYVILDDIQDFLDEQQDYFVNCSTGEPQKPWKLGIPGLKEECKIKAINILNMKDKIEYLINVTLSNESQIEKYKLPEYYSKNNVLINNLYNTLKENKNIISEDIDRNVQLISDNISELEFRDIHLEITKSEVIKFTTVFDDNKILIISKDVSDTDTDIIYSYFINRQLIASDVADISIFTKKFKEYLCL